MKSHKFSFDQTEKGDMDLNESKELLGMVKRKGKV